MSTPTEMISDAKKNFRCKLTKHSILATSFFSDIILPARKTFSCQRKKNPAVRKQKCFVEGTFHTV